MMLSVEINLLLKLEHGLGFSFNSWYSVYVPFFFFHLFYCPVFQLLINGMYHNHYLLQTWLKCIQTRRNKNIKNWKQIYFIYISENTTCFSVLVFCIFMFCSVFFHFLNVMRNLLSSHLLFRSQCFFCCIFVSVAAGKCIWSLYSNPASVAVIAQQSAQFLFLTSTLTTGDHYC